MSILLKFDFLDHTILPNLNVQAMIDVTQMQKQKDLKFFLGLSVFYRRIIKDYDTPKDVPFIWTTERWSFSASEGITS